MSFIVYSPESHTKILKANPNLITLNSLEASSLPCCPLCGKKAVRNGQCIISCPETDMCGNNSNNPLKVQRIKCSDKKCLFEVGYVPMTYPGTNFRTSLFYKAVFAFSKIYGIIDTASLLGITVDEVKRCVEIISPKQFSKSKDSLIAYHMIGINGKNYMIAVDVTNRIILDVWAANNKNAAIRRILKHSSDFSRLIIPNDEKIVARLRLKKEKDALIIERINKINAGNYQTADVDSLKIIESAHRQALGHIILNNFILNLDVKKKIIGFF